MTANKGKQKITLLRIQGHKYPCKAPQAPVVVRENSIYQMIKVEIPEFLCQVTSNSLLQILKSGTENLISDSRVGIEYTGNKVPAF